MDLAQVFGQDVTYSVLATAFHVNPYEILSELAKANGTNEKAFDDIHRAFLAERPWLTSFSDRRRRVEQYWAEAHGGGGLAKQKLPFLNWKIPKNVVIRLPLSAKTAPLVTADTAEVSRFIKLAIGCPEFAKLELIIEELEGAAERLESTLTALASNVEASGAECLPYLLSAQRLLLMMYQAIPNTPEAVVHHHLHEHDDLLDELQRVVERAGSLIYDDAHLFDWYNHARVNDEIGLLFAILTNGDNIKCLTALRSSYDIAEQRDVWARFEAALLHAGSLLLRTDRADELVSNHLIPFLGAMAESANVQRMAQKVAGTPFEAVLRDGWRSVIPNKPATLLSTIGTVGSLGAGAVGNSRGPASLAVSLTTMAGPRLAKFLALRSLSLNNSGTLGTALCLRLLLQVADFSADVDIDHLLDAILPDQGARVALASLENISWETKLMSGSMWTGVYALANLAALLSIVSSDGDVTLKRVGQALQTGAQAAVPLAEISAALLGKYARISSVLLNSASQAAHFAGVLAIAISVWTIGEEAMAHMKGAQVDFSVVVNIVGSAATAVSSGVWLYLAVSGMRTTALATALMGIGSVLSIALLIASIGYETATRGPGTAAYVLACLNEFKATDAGKTLLSDKTFRKEFTAFESQLDSVKPKLVSFKGKQSELYTLMKHFSVDGCATIVEMDPAVVREIVGLK
ncbi:hypothetical protein DB30_00301 [Enhygromyxa salina]|uniref:Uncharacterized protein n=1 Tax=Enhygromyxa salina TaxID=215803 RepID=A0A0C2D626_9BACT|nr:hypothetical protein DB30_00301 [Enhygromyxa salina]